MADTKHRTVFRYLEGRIRSGRYLPGAQLPTEISLGKKLGVSRPTIARAMRDLQGLGLVERRAGAGSYVLDVEADKGVKSMFGLLVPELGCDDIFDPICAELVRRAQQGGSVMILGDMGNPQLRKRDGVGRLDVSVDGALQAADSFVKQGVSGVFFAPLSVSGQDRETNQRILAKLTEADIRVVLLDRDFESFPKRSQYDLVAVNHLVGQYLATQHLIDVGHRKILYLQWPGVTDSLQKRIAGMRVCLSEQSESACQGEVIEGDPSNQEFIEALMRTHLPDAIMCENDMVATHLLRTFSSLKVSVPDDLSVIGFNDVTLAKHLSTPLTTIQQPCRGLGEVAVDLMNLRINDPDAPARTVLLEPRLIERESVKRIR